MNWTKLSAIAEILSSIAIVVTLIYLTVEIQQNTDSLQATARQALRDAQSQRLAQVMNDPDIWINLSNPDMTDAEKVRLSAYLISVVRDHETDWLQYQAGALDEATWITNQSGVIDTLSYSESRKWWDFYASIGEFDPAFIENLNGLLENELIRTRLTDLRAFD